MRTGRLTTVVAVSLGVTAGGVIPAAAIARVNHCRSVRTDRFLHLAAHGVFGATSIRATGAGCPRARSIASRYVRNPFSVDSPRHRTKRIEGWSCMWRTSLHVAQQVSVTCTESSARIRFNDTLPNG